MLKPTKIDKRRQRNNKLAERFFFNKNKFKSVEEYINREAVI